MTARSYALYVLAAAAAAIAGCAATDPVATAARDAYCVKTVLRQQTVCIPGGVPQVSVERDAKRFEPTPGLLTVYIVRAHPYDNMRLLSVSVNGGAPMPTLRYSLIRLRLPPGAHVVSYQSIGQQYEHTVQGSAGEVRWVELTAENASFARRIHWSDTDKAGAMARARGARLVADVQ